MDDAGKKKPHAVCVPYPAQGHITPMFKLAKLLHHRGFHITFVHTEYNQRRLMRSRGPLSLKGLEDFRFETIPDGLPPSSADATQDIPALSDSTSKTCLGPFRELLKKLNRAADLPQVTCIVSDGAMSFTLDAAQEIQVPEVLFWTPSACGFLCYLHYQKLIEQGITPLKEQSSLSNREVILDSVIDCIPGVLKNFRFRDLPSFVRTTDPDDIMLNYVIREAQRASKAAAVVLNTYYELESGVLDSMASALIPPIYSIGPLQILCDQIIPDNEQNNIGANLWREQTECLEWLDTQEPKSVVYVNLGSIAVMSPQQLVEFAWGLANSKQSFLWVIRPDLVMGESAVVPPEFVEVTAERAMLLSWVPQEKILSHPSVGGFLTHCGWNSMLESICNGVPVICWPFFAEQQTNCRYACDAWGIGMEMDNAGKREEVERHVREVMEGEKGREMREKALEWKASAEKATSRGGSSRLHLEKLVRVLTASSSSAASFKEPKD